MALPMQLIVAGPLARWIFRAIFRRNEENCEDNLLYKTEKRSMIMTRSPQGQTVRETAWENEILVDINE